MKQCKNCKITKELSEYYRDKNRNDGRMSQCKKCRDAYYVYKSRTKNGVISRIYSDQRKSSRARGHDYPSYSNIELREWVLSQPVFHAIYDEWVNSGYVKRMKPSCDRFSETETNYNDLPYSLDRLRVVRWSDNEEARNVDMRKGLLITTDKPQKPVRQYYNGIFIEEHVSASEAGRQLGIHQSNISACCRGKKKTAGMFEWIFA